jgi:hypothetical protein
MRNEDGRVFKMCVMEKLGYPTGYGGILPIQVGWPNKNGTKGINCSFETEKTVIVEYRTLSRRQSLGPSREILQFAICAPS